MEVIVKAIAALETYINNKKQELSDFIAWIEQSPIARKLKTKHLEILKAAVKEPGREFTAQQVADNLGVSLNTARTYLKRLVQEDLLVLSSKKRVRTVRYLAPADLRERLLKCSDKRLVYSVAVRIHSSFSNKVARIVLEKRKPSGSLRRIF